MKKSLILSLLVLAPGLALAGLVPPKGPILERNIDHAAQSAFDQWVTQLSKSPHIDAIRTIGILPLADDTAQFTTLLEARLSQLPNVKVVILRGPKWDAIEEEVARTDPSEGFGDIMNKASLIWQEVRGEYQLPESALGADALVFGQVRRVDPDWPLSRVTAVLMMGSVAERTLIAGGTVEGESTLGWKDLALYYKGTIVIIALGVIGLIVLVCLLKGFVRAMTRPR